MNRAWMVLCALLIPLQGVANTLSTKQQGIDDTCNVELDPASLSVPTGELVTVEIAVEPGVTIDGFTCAADLCVADFSTRVSETHLLMFDTGDPTKTAGARLDFSVERDGTTTAAVAVPICPEGNPNPGWICIPEDLLGWSCCACPCEPDGCGTGW